MSRDIDYQTNLTVFDQVYSIWVFSIFTELSRISYNRTWHMVLLQNSGSFLRCVDCVAKLVQLVCAVCHFVLQTILSRNQNTLLRNLEASRQERLQKGLFLGSAEACDLPGRRHLDSKHRIGSTKTCKREHRGLHTHESRRSVSCLKSWEVHIVGRNTHNGLRCRFNVVDSHCLRHEREGSRCTDITLNTHDICSLGDKLDVDWSSDVQTLHDLLGCISHSVFGVCGKILGWKDQRSISGVDTGILNVFVNGSCDNLAISTNTIEFDLNSPFNEIRDHNRMLL
mmetsp:Transcript_13097/g.18821  ORF Transcript_13097/g.18821 Transcript_13097/m.18821 type:complete len:283 (-) Transcript_13097:3073-3921(-)